MAGTTLPAFISAFSAVIIIIIIGEIQQKFYNLMNGVTVFITIYFQTSSSCLFFLYFFSMWFYKRGFIMDGFIDSTKNAFNNYYSIIIKAAYLWPVFVLATIASSYGFKYVHVSLNNALFQANVIFTFFITLIFLRIKSSSFRFLFVALSFMGMIILLWVDSNYEFGQFNNNNLIVLAAAFLFASYGCQYNYLFAQEAAIGGRVYQETSEEMVVELHNRNPTEFASVVEAPQDGNVSTTIGYFEQSLLVLATIGVMSLILLWPIIIILHFTGAEVIIYDSTNIGMIFVIGLLTACYNVLFGYAYSISSTLKVNMIIALQIPLGMLADYIAVGRTYPPLFYCGVVFIIAGTIGETFEKFFKRQADILYVYLFQRDF